MSRGEAQRLCERSPAPGPPFLPLGLALSSSSFFFSSFFSSFSSGLLPPLRRRCCLLGAGGSSSGSALRRYGLLTGGPLEPSDGSFREQAAADAVNEETKPLCEAEAPLSLGPAGPRPSPASLCSWASSSRRLHLCAASFSPSECVCGLCAE